MVGNKVSDFQFIFISQYQIISYKQSEELIAVNQNASGWVIKYWIYLDPESCGLVYP